MNVDFQNWIQFLSEIMAAADLLGRAQVQAEQRTALGVEFDLNPDVAFTDPLSLRLLASRLSPSIEGDSRAFSGRGFTEILPEGVMPQAAADYIRSKVAMTKKAFQTLLRKNRKQYKDYAFFIAQTESVPLIEAAQQAVARAIEEGLTLDDFKKMLTSVYDKLGVTELSPWHLETVFRTNIQSAYQAGRYQQLTDPDVKRVLPFWKYRAVMDSRTRPPHAAMNGFIAAQSDPIWGTWYPPNGYNCRCTVTALGTREAGHQADAGKFDLNVPARGRMPRVDGVPVRPDAGFEENPIVYFERAIERRGI